MAYRIKRVDGRKSAALLTRLHEQIFGKHESKMHNPKAEGYWWVAYDVEDGKPVGFCGLIDGRWPRTGYLNRAGVIVAARGHGLQRRFIRVREAFARKQGWWRLRTDVCDTPQSVNNLTATGYRNIMPLEPWALPRSTYWEKIIGVK